MIRIKREAERTIIYRMVIEILQRFDVAYKQYHGRGSSLGASLETYLIVAAVLIGEAENRLFTAHKLSSYLGLARGTVQRKLDHPKQLERSSASGLGIVLAMFVPKRQGTLTA